MNDKKDETQAESKSSNEITIRDGKFIFEFSFDKTPSVDELAVAIGSLFKTLVLGILKKETLIVAIKDAEKENSRHFKLDGFFDQKENTVDCGIYVGKTATGPKLIKPNGPIGVIKH